MKKIAFHWQVLIAMALGAALGALLRLDLPGGTDLLAVLDVVGQLFLNALKMLVIPLVVSSMVVGIAGVDRGLGRMGRNTLLFYLGSTLAAVLIGLLLVNLLQPGLSNGQPAGTQLALPLETPEALAKVEGKSASDMVKLLMDMVPANLFKAAADGNLLGLIVFSLLLGIFLGRLEGREREVHFAFWNGSQQLMMSITNLVLLTAPLGVLALIAKTVAQTGFAAIAPLAVFFLTVLLALLLHTLGSLSLALWQAGINPLKHLNAMVPAMLTAFSTASSNATIPVTLRCLEERAGVSPRVSGLVIPLGATVNMNGTALYECVAAIFIAQAYGLELSFTTQFTVVFIALVTSIGVAGIPAASLVAIAIILGAIGLPLEAIGLLLITDRLLDMCRTVVNIYGDSVAAVIVAAMEGEALEPLRRR